MSELHISEAKRHVREGTSSIYDLVSYKIKHSLPLTNAEASYFISFEEEQYESRQVNDREIASFLVLEEELYKYGEMLCKG